MRKLVCPRFPQFQACVSPLGQLHPRPLFGGYSLAIDDTVFAMVAEGNIYLKACEQSAAYRVEHRNPLLTLRRHGRIVPLYGAMSSSFFGYRYCRGRVRSAKRTADGRRAA